MYMYIRADGNDIIATGHIMRCIAIADAFKSKGEDTIFIIADEYPKEIIEQHGYKTICLNTVWNDMDTETDKMIELIKQRGIDKILIDSYFVTEDYLEKLREYSAIIYMDDLNQMTYPADVIINYSSYDRMDYNKQYCKTNTQLWLGSMYTPLRQEFFDCEYTLREKANRIFITTGGTDKYNVALQISNRMIKDNNDLELYIIAGRYNKNIPELLKLQSEYPENIFVFQNVDNMAELMQQCDMAISAGGTTLFELCACGIPTVCFGFADNQLELIRMLGEQNVMINIGDIREGMKEKIEELAAETFGLLKNKTLRGQYSSKMSAITDGKGALRIADKILDYTKLKER